MDLSTKPLSPLKSWDPRKPVQYNDKVLPGSLFITLTYFDLLSTIRIDMYMHVIFNYF